VFDYAIRHLNVPWARLNKSQGWIYARIAALRNHQIRLEPRVSRREAAVQSAFVKMVSWFRAELDCS
jgi:hypothetical protein